jgi:transposase
MGKRYSDEFKINAVKHCLDQNLTAAQTARELGVNENTMRQWLKTYKQNEEEPFVGSGNLRTEEREIKELKKRIRDLEEENEILKKVAAIFAANRKR